MSDKIFEGQVKNVADGDIFDITITSVSSVPCIDPYCDNIIATEKSKLRNGLCGNCYKDVVRKKIDNKNKVLRTFFPLLVFVILLNLFLYIFDFFFKSANSKISTAISAIFFISLFLLILFIWTAHSHQKIIYEKYDLKKKNCNDFF